MKTLVRETGAFGRGGRPGSAATVALEAAAFIIGVAL